MSRQSVVGVVVEYNPFHNGHAYHLREARRVSGANAVVAVMSGNWLQRGEPALMHKWARAEAALLAGVDLVLELPVAFSTQPAEWFAYGAMSALNETGIVDAVCFGSESGDIGTLYALAERLREEPDSFAGLLRQQLKAGAPYPAAYAAAVGQLTGTPGAALLAEPNNSLGFHYVLSLLRLNSRMRPLTVQRVKAGYRDARPADASVASATAIRHRLLAADRSSTSTAAEAALAAVANYIPASTLRVLEREWLAGRAPLHWERYRNALFHRLLIQSADALSVYREASEGLEHRLKASLARLGADATVEKLIEAMKTRRYTRTKLQRLLTAIYLEHRREAVHPSVLRDGVPYLRVLGFTDAGQSLLSRMKRTARAPIITAGIGRSPHPMLALDAAATSAYAIGYAAPSTSDLLADYYMAPVRTSLTGSDSK